MKSINTYLRSSNNSTSGVVWILFYIKRKKIHFSTKVEVEKKHWSEKKCVVLPGDKKYQDKNLIIDSILTRVNNVFVKFRLRDKELSKDLFLREYNRPSDYDTFFDYVHDYMKRISSRTEATTLDTHITVIKKLKSYNENLIFDEITTSWLDHYFSYLRKDLGNNSNTAYKNMVSPRATTRF